MAKGELLIWVYRISLTDEAIGKKVDMKSRYDKWTIEIKSRNQNRLFLAFQMSFFQCALLLFTAACSLALDPAELGEPWAGNAQLIKEQNYSGAIERLHNYAKSTSKIDDMAAFYYTIGDIHYKYTHDYNSALNAYQVVVDLNKKATSPAQVEPYMALSRMLMAAIYMRIGKYDDAIEAYRKVAADYPETRFASGAIRDINSIKYALPEIKSLKQIISKHPNTELAAEAQFEIAELYYLSVQNLNDPQQAIEEYTVLVDKYPNNRKAAEAQLKIGNVYWALHEPKKAITEYQELVQDNLSANRLEAEAIFRIGRIYYNELSDHQKALDIFSKFMNNYPTYWKFPAGIYWQGMCYEQLGQYSDAISSLETFIQLYPENRPGWLADIDQFGNKNVKSRIQTKIEELKKIAPERIWNKAEQFRSQGKYYEALVTYRELISKYPENEFARKAGLQVNKVIDLAEIQICQEAIKRKGSEASTSQYRIAEIYEIKFRDYSKAIKIYGKVVGNYPDSHQAAEALYRMGLIYSGMESTELLLANNNESIKIDYKKAIEKYRQLVEKYPDTDAAARGYYQIGEIYRTHLKDYDQALEAYSKVVNEYPIRNFYEGKGCINSLADAAQFRMGRIYYENLQNYDMAFKIFSKFMNDFPDSCRKAAAHSFIAAIHEKRENKEASADSLEQIIDIIVESDIQSSFFVSDALYDGAKKQENLMSKFDFQGDIIKQIRQKISQLRARVARGSGDR